jgi:uncharacterized protein YbaR (Trm112 family)
MVKTTCDRCKGPLKANSNMRGWLICWHCGIAYRTVACRVTQVS